MSHQNSIRSSSQINKPSQRKPAANLPYGYYDDSSNSYNKSPIYASQIQVTKQKVNLTQKQILANDMSGRLYGEIERLFQLCRVPISPQYGAYLIHKPSTLQDSMLNIEGFLRSLSFYSDYSSHLQVEDHKFAEDPQTFELWKALLTQISHSREFEVAKEVLTHAINCASDGKIKRLPLEVSEKVMKKGMRDSLAKNVVKNRMSDGLKMHLQADHVVGVTKRQLEAMEGREITFEKRPALQIGRGDLEYGKKGWDKGKGYSPK